MATVQTNWRIDKEVRDWIVEQAAKDDRNPAYFLSKLIRGHMNKQVVKKARVGTIGGVVKEPVKRKTRMPDDFELTPPRARRAQVYWTSKKRPDLSVYEVFEEFKNHYQASGDTWLDWDKVWNKWYARAVKFNKPPGGGGNYGQSKQSNSSKLEQQAAELFNETNPEREISGSVVDTSGRPVSGCLVQQGGGHS